MLQIFQRNAPAYAQNRKCKSSQARAERKQSPTRRDCCDLHKQQQPEIFQQMLEFSHEGTGRCKIKDET